MSWPLVKLGDVCERVSVGHVGTTSEFYTDEAGVPFLRTQNVGSDGVSLEDVKYITHEFHKTLRKSTLAANDVVMSRVVSTSVNCGIVPESLAGANCANIILARPIKDKLVAEYLVHYLRSSDVQGRLLARQVGSAQSVVNTGVLKSWEIPLPPLHEQKRIAAILDKADAIRRKRQQAIQLADDFLRAVFLNMFELSALETVNLGSLCNVKGGKRLPQGHDYSELPTKHPYIRVVDFQGGTVRRSKLKYIDEATHSKISNYTIASNDVYISIAGTVGVSGVVPEDLSGANLTENAAKLILKDNSVLEAEYLAYWLSTSEAQAQIRSKTMLTSQPKLALFRIEELLLPLPNIHEQRKFLLVKKKIHSLLESMKHDWEAAGSLFEAASQKAFSGQL